MDSSVHKAVLTTPFVQSWVSLAASGDRLQRGFEPRAAAWAQWALVSLVQMTGWADRSYPAIRLDGHFYDPTGSEQPVIAPHLEIPGRVLNHPDRWFPFRLAAAGSGLAFPGWVQPEVTAVKRAVFDSGSGPIDAVLTMLDEHRGALEAAVVSLLDQAGPHWFRVEDLLVTDPERLTGLVAPVVTEPELAAFLPAAAGCEITFEPKLADQSRGRAARRVGVWQLRHRDGGRLGIVTPRLTAGSQFRDPLFAVERDGVGSLLVRGVVLRRLLTGLLGWDPAQVGVVEEPVPVASRPPVYLRAVVPQVGAKLPEAGVDAAVLWLRAFPDAGDGWDALVAWAERSSTVLTVGRDGFIAAHRGAWRSLVRGEELDRDAINTLLPLGWDAQQRVVRVTCAKRPGQ